MYLYKEANAIFLGGESSVHYKMNRAIANEIGIEYVWNKNLQSTLPLPFTPPYSILDEIKLTPFRSKQFHYLTVNATGHYFAPQNRVDRNEPRTDDYLLMHLSLSTIFDMGKNKLSIFLQIRNIANSRYLNNMSRYRMLNLPEQGRNFQIILKYSF
jgi:iron complex outermembrane receptor protein